MDIWLQYLISQNFKLGQILDKGFSIVGKSVKNRFGDLGAVSIIFIAIIFIFITIIIMVLKKYNEMQMVVNV